MDKAPLRRGMPTVHSKYGEAAALLSGDVMLVAAYEYLNQIRSEHFHTILNIFNKTAREVCEGQQMDMDFEGRDIVTFEDYENMIALKTSVLLASSLQIGAIIGGAGSGNQKHIYEFGRNLGMAFQVQDDYLDAFGNPEKFGKQVGGDILSNKKTFLLIHALNVATPLQSEKLMTLMSGPGDTKVNDVLCIYRDCKVDVWAAKLKDQYLSKALTHLEDIAVLSSRKEELKSLAGYLLQREN
jgi:geranylgeranyl diphosphate synthase type II